MAFAPKVWQDSPSTSTPISAAALEDLETRVTQLGLGGVVTTTTDYSAQPGDVVYSDPASGGATITLPAPSLSTTVSVMAGSSAAGGNATTVSSVSSNIFGQEGSGIASTALTVPGTALVLTSDGTNWYVVGDSAAGGGGGGGGGGDLLAANNLSDVANVTTSRTNLGLGTAAVHPIAFFLQTASDLSDLASRTTSIRNLGVARGTASVTFTASTVSAVTTVSHGLGLTPIAVTANGTNDTGGFGLMVAYSSSNHNSSSFGILGRTTNSISSTVPVTWIAVA